MPVASVIQEGVRTSRDLVADVASRAPDQPVAVLRAAAFWLAVVLPAAYLPIAALPATRGDPLLPGLLVVHALCVALGYDHSPGG